jgi:hypothetical protein
VRTVPRTFLTIFLWVFCFRDTWINSRSSNASQSQTDWTISVPVMLLVWSPDARLSHSKRWIKDIEVSNIRRFLTENATSGVTLISCTSSVGCMPSKSPDIESKCCGLDSYPVQHAGYILRWTHSPTNRRSESHATTVHRWCFATMAKWIFLYNRSFCRCFLQLFCFQPLDTNHACSLTWSLKNSQRLHSKFSTHYQCTRDRIFSRNTEGKESNL